VNRIEERLKKLKRCLIPFITAGHPSLEITYELVKEFEKVGVGMVELGIPFSDPIADGPIIQYSSNYSLNRGTTPRDVLALVKHLRTTTHLPIILLTYYNPVYKYGVKRFVDDSYSAGVDGVIIPDLPPEEAEEIRRYAFGKISTIFLLAPTSGVERIRLVAQYSTGFIYYVSLTGITGVRERLSSTIRSHLEEIRKYTDLPIGVGFGVSNKNHVKEVAKVAEGVIVGSAIVKMISHNEKDSRIVQKVGEFVSSLVDGVRESTQ
jgi:tryptophan synthase alpha chain